MAVPLECMFDTNVFDRILDGHISAETMVGRVVAYATHIQRDEIANIPDTKAERRTALAALFLRVVQDEPPTESAAWGVSKYDRSKWTAPDNLCTPIRAALDKIKPKPNNIRDALIAETAIKRGYILVTEDENLAKVAGGFGARCLSVPDLIKAVESWQGG